MMTNVGPGRFEIERKSSIGRLRIGELDGCL